MRNVLVGMMVFMVSGFMVPQASAKLFGGPEKKHDERMSMSSESSVGVADEKLSVLDSPSAAADSKSDEIAVRIKGIESQVKNIERIEKQLAKEKAQLEEMRAEFCLNFKDECSKVSGGN